MSQNQVRTPSVQTGRWYAGSAPTPTSRIPWWLVAIVVIFLLFCVGSLFLSYLIVGGLAREGDPLLGDRGTPLTNHGGIPFHQGIQVRSASLVADSFLQGLKDHDWLEAYNNVDLSVMIHLPLLDFVHQAKRADSCAGSITSYQLVRQTWLHGVSHLIYRVKRRHAVMYWFQFFLAQKGDGDWTITAYGKDDTVAPSDIADCR